jgi:putative membrane protein
MMIGGGFVIGFILLILFLLLIGGAIAAVIWFVRQGSHTTSQVLRQESPHQESRALEILRERYARGEIDREEFARMREELRS